MIARCDGPAALDVVIGIKVDAHRHRCLDLSAPPLLNSDTGAPQAPPRRGQNRSLCVRQGARR